MFLKIYIKLGLFIISFLSVFNVALCKSISENNSHPGLYGNGNDSLVRDIYGLDLHKLVFDQDHATYLEFYNSFCGFCRRFAPKWKAVGNHVKPWQSLVKVFAFDCSSDENNDLCREFEVMAYPTIRYFPPNYSKGTKTIGTAIHYHEEQELVDALALSLSLEPNPPKSWPDITLHKVDDLKSIFTEIPASKAIKYAILIVEKHSGNGTFGIQTILNFPDVKEILFQRISANSTFVQSMNLSFVNYTLVVVDRDCKTEALPIQTETLESMQSSIEAFLSKHSIKFQTTSVKPVESKPKSANSKIEDVINEMQDQAIFEKIKTMRSVIFRADLEQAVRYSLFHEIPMAVALDGERLLALRRFVNILYKYFPFNEEGKNFISKVNDFLNQGQDEIKTEAYKEMLEEFQYANLFSGTRYVGCYSKIQGLRRHPCSLWTLFHFLTVQAAADKETNNPLEVLQAMHGYIKNYFGCTDCSEHFQAMAARNAIWNVTNKDETVLWLWSSHNEVNKRLSGDMTEDPDFKKIQFPSGEDCPDCRMEQSADGSENQSNLWNRENVLQFLKKIYAVENLSDLGTENEYLMSKPAKHTQDNPLLSNMFSDLDIRMGILLYISMICIMIVSIKLLIKRKYRKKLYVHDILGKV